jgi:phosphoglycolate phosphatase
MKYETYVFDFDFTLADATVGIVKSVNYALNQLGLKSESCDNIRKTVGMTLGDTLFELTGVSDNQAIELFVSHFKLMADKVMTNNTILFTDTKEVLDYIYNFPN